MITVNINHLFNKLLILNPNDLEQIELHITEAIRNVAESTQGADHEGVEIRVNIKSLCGDLEIQSQDREQTIFSEFKEFVKDWADGNCTTIEATEALENFKQALYPETV